MWRGGQFGVFGRVLVRVLGQGVDPGEVHFGPPFRGQEGAAGDGDDRTGSGPPGDGGGQLTGQGLLVEAAFTGNDDVAGVLAGIEVQQVQEVVGAGDLFCPEQQAGVPDSAGAAGAWTPSQPGRVGESRRRQLGDEMFEAFVEGRDLFRSGALLGTEDGRCALGAEQRVVDVAGDDQLGVGQLSEGSPVDAVDLCQRPAAAVELAAVGVAEAVPERGEHAHAAVGAGAAAQGQHDPGRFQAEGEQHGFAEAAAGRAQRIQGSARVPGCTRRSWT